MAAKRFPYSPTEHGRRRLYASVAGKPKAKLKPKPQRLSSPRLAGVYLNPQTLTIRLEFIDGDNIEHTIPLDPDAALATAVNLITAVRRVLKMEGLETMPDTTRWRA